ncbi:MAG: hypothetical protein B7Z44_14290 [Caulobacter sp. 12-67-6]|nr:MAG: hypothetical protein B7Z44_14290 [Caulobacter sp. 12-67-6]
MSETKPNPFGFEGLGDGSLDLTDFAPKPKVVDRDKAEVTREVARDNGFTRRAVSKPAGKATPSVVAPVGGTKATPAPEKGRKRRVSIAELLGLEDRYPESERAQLNMLAPVPVALRWRGLVREANLPAWEILEQAMDALEAQAGRGKAKD